ncbi:lipase [Actinoallomurus iriomotensis]|uniref:Lipase n=2 Tax=Actinoallomurus iriomotensis TaxID=478107 RepID=A0A9W6S8Q9_9ACTN|nr:lipase [Actinoallomurus iriomotensis]
MPSFVGMRILSSAALAGLALAGVVSAPTQSSATSPHGDDSGGRGRVVSAKKIAGLSREQTASYLDTMNFGSPAPRYGIDEYAIVYRTITPTGAPTTASGLLILPRSKDRTLRTVAYEHGTNPTRLDAATTSAESYDRAAAALMAAAGFGTVAPDYLGLGLGPGHHPYMDHASETTASLDMLRAAGEVAADHGRSLTSKVRVTGFSQGGAAAMALGRVLQARGRLVALAPISGPYDVEHAEIPVGLHGDRLSPQEVTFYLGYWTTSMNRLHHFYTSPSEVFQKPYDETVETLFDGDHSGAQIFAGLPATPQELLRPEFVARLDHPDGSLARALRENDDTCSNWRPRVPIRIFAAHGDKDVTILNARHCQAQLREHGVDAPLTDVGATDHNGSAFRSVPQVVRWFASL